jgi:pyruvate, water dikinase
VYNFGVVDAYCSPSANRNYINLHFRGGAADLVRRARRARAVAEILRALGLHAETSRDAVDARLSRASQEETARQLEMIGRLLQFVRQMDVAMVNDEAVVQLREAFLRGDYGLTGEGDSERLL